MTLFPKFHGFPNDKLNSLCFLLLVEIRDMFIRSEGGRQVKARYAGRVILDLGE